MKSFKQYFIEEYSEDIILIGTIDINSHEIYSEEVTKSSKKTHKILEDKIPQHLNYHELKRFRYDPHTNIVFWWLLQEDINPEWKISVNLYIRKRYDQSPKHVGMKEKNKYNVVKPNMEYADYTHGYKTPIDLKTRLQALHSENTQYTVDDIYIGAVYKSGRVNGLWTKKGPKGKTHANLGGINLGERLPFRYDPYTNTVFWWEFSHPYRKLLTPYVNNHVLNLKISSNLPRHKDMIDEISGEEYTHGYVNEWDKTGSVQKPLNPKAMQTLADRFKSMQSESVEDLTKIETEISCG